MRWLTTTSRVVDPPCTSSAVIDRADEFGGEATTRNPSLAWTIAPR
ncbi:hypothetical protein Pd630_LPD10084 (plasmid) [Rhodococcus opacus PD630]|nr:hypothetical protein Pd630_LPD10084 [Rhodococcus opacus PD630]